MLDTQVTKLSLKDDSLLETRAYVNGVWIEKDETFPVYNPATGDLIANVSDLSVEDTSAAIDAAYAAKADWASWTGKERAGVLRKWFDLMVENADDLATILTAEMGKPWAEARGEIIYGASFIEWFAEEAKRVYGDVIPGHQRDKRIVVLKQPIGVVGSITPWNFPNAMIARKVAPALAVGCTFVARPAELTPLSALAMAVLGERAGIPAGVLNVIPSSDSAGIGQELCANEKVAKITFTGSTRVGKILMSQCSDTIKKMSLELGGNAPFLVFDDADIDAAVEGAMIAKYRNNGQTCVCANRIYVQAGVYDEFAAKLKAKVASLSIGDGFADGITTGPLINEAAVAKVEDHIADAVEKGATIVEGGTRSNLGGTFFQPTVLTGVTRKMKVAKEETFGPVAPLFKFEDEADVVAMANDSEFGLASYFYSRDLSRVWRVAEALESGMVGINTGLISTEVAPFGGIKQSGLGREGSKYGTEDFLEMKYLCMGEIN
ncbi:NAD-dependent succinate-semialdehyde dehydrogenase [Shimia thalassica]|uniref:NAD-dependent succinate-semialdehyde dehydrogenase n=1 Tax=Shimia thalassica TaxID=1715693 RepID=UPI001C08CCCB|nr:NAD-dependent succinate-semialdehyde dehydrogenase [Shimia thalassica]MBU2942608.1 NAD-dependent succinate-semialdehyde dehydrogenase [Shimia thalassica]MDO6481028.1 NAD-dependent succinate-semialdehyde dehydrogenase [Shimia thalassica]MDO6504539.1 NAD-dependent succinate-semialdehyde dehydrogenase [Shimia thalassica]MDO6800127.1 NAD-dependent succinate-semialdehyde dehydrogenase [Shimia thalassica]MDP2496054.1 NAD-dependent succinate-semialdehyde dehydrogenase [Shimia thalassica]